MREVSKDRDELRFIAELTCGVGPRRERLALRYRSLAEADEQARMWEQLRTDDATAVVCVYELLAISDGASRARAAAAAQGGSSWQGGHLDGQAPLSRDPRCTCFEHLDGVSGRWWCPVPEHAEAVRRLFKHVGAP